MHDYYNPIPELIDPNTNEVLEDWQGKDGPCALFIWEQNKINPIDQFGDEDIKLSKDELNNFYLPKKFIIYTTNSKGDFLFANCECKNKIWKKTKLIKL